MPLLTKSKPGMKKRYLIGGAFILLVILVNISNYGKKSEPIPQKPSQALKDSVVSEIKKEKKVKEAFLTDANVLYAYVIDDKTKRDGYATYLCQAINERKAGIDRVKIIAVGSIKAATADNAYGRLLGSCWCETYKTGN